jgi:signal peptidase II
MASFVSDLGFARAVLGVFAFVITLGFLFAVARAKHMTWLEIVALGLVAGGALGNGIDRSFHEVPGGGTGVVDFIRVNYPWGGSWPAFNIADVLIAVGAGLLLIVGFGRRLERGASPQYG